MQEIGMSAVKRIELGKNASGRIRRQGLIPAILYGPGIKENVLLNLKKAEVEKILIVSGGNALINLNIEGDKPRKVMFKSIGRDPVRDSIEHIDLFNIRMDHKVTVLVPLNIVGKSEGVEQGGILHQEVRGLKVECLPNRIPGAIDVDVTTLKIGDSMHVKDITPPEGVKIKEDGSITVLLISAPAEEVAVKTKEEVEAELAKSFEEKPEEKEAAEKEEKTSGTPGKEKKEK